jgi:hypothetical protein
MGLRVNVEERFMIQEQCRPVGRPDLGSAANNVPSGESVLSDRYRAQRDAAKTWLGDRYLLAKQQPRLPAPWPQL